MRSVISVVLSFTLFASTSIAQSGTQKLAEGSQAIAEHLEPQMPIGLYECDNTQCEDPNSGGAVWLFEGEQGQGMWLYGAVTKLTVREFDGRTIRIHREDPVGTYSQNYALSAATPFYADYEGTVSGSSVVGHVYWNGGPNPDTWHATIVNGDFCGDGAPKCPLRADELSVLGRRAAEAKMFDAAYACFRLSALQRDADGEGFVATMIMNGFGPKLAPEQILALLKDSADRDSYPGEKGLARAYEEGIIVPKDAKQAAFWSERASSWQARKQAQEDASMQGRVMGQALIFAMLLGALSGDADSTSAQERAERGRQEDMQAFKRMWQARHP